MNRFGKRLLVLGGVTLLSVALATLASRSATAQGDGAAAPELEGTWRTTIDGPGGPLEVLHTFIRGGVALNAAPFPGQMNGQGVWTRLGPHRFGFTLQMFWLDPDTGQMAKTIVKEVIEVSNNGDEYKSLEASGVDYYPDGRTFPFCATTHGTRMKVELPDPCPPSATGAGLWRLRGRNR